MLQVLPQSVTHCKGRRCEPVSLRYTPQIMALWGKGVRRGFVTRRVLGHKRAVYGAQMPRLRSVNGRFVMAAALCAASSTPVFPLHTCPHVPLTLHMGLLKCGLFEAKNGKRRVERPTFVCGRGGRKSRQGFSQEPQLLRRLFRGCPLEVVCGVNLPGVGAVCL